MKKIKKWLFKYIGLIKIPNRKFLAYAKEFFSYDSIKDALRACEKSYKKFKKDWASFSEKKGRAPALREELLKFYTSTDVYVVGLIEWHSRLGPRRMQRAIAKNCSGKVLDYGGGIGNFSLNAWKRGCDVTYAEVEGKTGDFAKFLFSKENAKIKVLTVPKDAGKLEMYDTILFLDVIEHLSDEDQRIVLKKLIAHLTPGGKLIITNYMCEGTDKETPMDRKVCYDVKKYLLENGFEQVNWFIFRKKDSKHI